MSKTRDTGYLANVIQVHDTGVRIMSGSTMLMAVSSSGAVTITGEISGSDAANALLLSAPGSVGFTTTSSFLAVSSSQQQVSASYIALSASYNVFSGSASTRITANSSSIQQVSSSQQQISSSLLQVSASYISLSGSYTTFSGSVSTRITENSSSIQQVSASQQQISSSQQQISSSLLNVISVFATTGSNSFRADQSITGSLVVSSTITAQTLVVQTVTSSIVYSSGSNIFGSALGDRQTFTGSLNVTGSCHAIFGNVGIGLSNPTNRLEVQSGDIKLNSGASRCTNIFFGITGTNYGKIQYSDIDGSMLITTIGSGGGYDLNLGTQCTTRLTILGDGKVGIGTATPLSTFHVNCCIAGGATATVARFGVQDSTGYGTTSPAIELVGTNIGLCFTMGKIAGINDVSSGGAMAFSTGLCAATVLERMRITNTGNVGIGTSSPCTLLHTVIPTCYGTNGTVVNSYPVATFSQCDCGAGARGLQIGIPTGGVVSPVFLKVNNTGARFSIIDQSNCENFTISGGKVGIGITAPEYPLHIYNCNRTGMKIQTCDSTFGSPSINLLNVAVDTVLSATNTGLEIGTWTANDILFRTTQVERMRITSAGIACFACQVCAPSGVKFGSGTTTLNYYEEGSWTPTFSNSSTTPSYLTQTGKYTRIGRVVHVVGKIGASNLGSGTVYIGGLPFSSADASDAGQRVSPRAEGDWSGFNCTYLLTSTMFRSSGTTFIGVRDNGSGQSIYADHSSYGSTLYFNFHGTYYV